MWGLKTRRSSIWRVAFTPVAFADADAPEKEGEAEVIGGAGSVSPLAEGSDPGGPLLLDLSATRDRCHVLCEFSHVISYLWHWAASDLRRRDLWRANPTTDNT